MRDRRDAIESVLRRVDDTLRTARHGLDDLLGANPARKLTGLRNLIVFGRSVTFVLQNLRSVVHDEFDHWYKPHQQALKDDPLMRFFVVARNDLEKQGKLNVATAVHIKSFSGQDMSKFGPPPPGATGFFIGDQLGGTGWEVKFPNGIIEKYYVELPPEIGSVTQHFSDLLAEHAPELRTASVADLSRQYIERLATLVVEARRRFLP